jgi:hypothetical protein
MKTRLFVYHNMENKDLTLHPEALELKQLGFDEPCIAWYAENKGLQIAPDTFKKWTSKPCNNSNIITVFNSDCITAPTYSQAFRWFREKYNLRGFIGFRPNVKMFDYHIYDMSLSGLEYTKQRTMEEFNKDPKVGTYEEAELACLKKLIEIVKEK